MLHFLDQPEILVDKQGPQWVPELLDACAEILYGD